jgi:hypothetical protein
MLLLRGLTLLLLLLRALLLRMLVLACHRNHRGPEVPC